MILTWLHTPSTAAVAAALFRSITIFISSTGHHTGTKWSRLGTHSIFYQKITKCSHNVTTQSRNLLHRKRKCDWGIMTMRRTCSSRKYSYPHHSPSHGGHFCFRSPPHQNFHSRGCLSYSPPPQSPARIKINQSLLNKEAVIY